MTRKRKSCWPNPDKVCLQGGCIHCVDGKWVAEEQIRSYAEKDDELFKAFLEGMRSPLRFEWSNSE
jgi:hypothetical protein